jgi:hypothetical protein
MAGNSKVRSHPGQKRAQRGTEHPPAAVEDAPQAALSAEDRERWETIAAAAYFRAEKRGFAPGNEIDDWLAAEREIAHRLSGHSEPLLERLRRERDELRVQIHLAKLDLRKEWDELEHKWELVRTRPRSAHREARRAGKEVALAAGAVLGDIREGYRRIRAALQVTR